MTEREAHLIHKAYEEVKKYEEQVEKDPYRLTFHLMPPVGLLNDPNGLIQYNDVYHVFFQWNPFDTTHGSKFWGHYSSKDLIHWKKESVALAPSEWYEKNGCYSGSAVEWAGKLYLFYTGNVKKENGDRETYQCMAISDDGIHFEKKGPVLELPEGYTAHFRDPKVWKHDDDWYMIVGAQTLDEKGTAVIFQSKDLYHWKEAGRIAGADMNGLNDFGYMWECPDLIHLNGQDLLLVSPQGLEPSGHFYHNVFQSGYFVGKMDYDHVQFQHGPFVELDRGFDFYAPQTFKDASGRTILYGWMGITDDMEPYHPTINHHWVHALTIPRELELRKGKLYQKPLEELKGLRKERLKVNHVNLTENQNIEIQGIKGKALELIVDFLKIEGNKFGISFRNEAVLTYEPEREEIRLQRRNIKTGGHEIRRCKLSDLDKLHVFMDRSSIEIFINDGEEVFTARYFPDSENETIQFFGDHVEMNITKWELKPFTYTGQSI
ncbi:sucrose-6-phosphate hydrolase [Niallia sp. Krafla_26]